MPTQIAQMEMDQPAELIQPLQDEEEQQQPQQQQQREGMEVEVEAAPAAASAPAADEPAQPQPTVEEDKQEFVFPTSEAKQENPGQESLAQDPESAIKFLIPNYLAGSLIGKKGATIKDIQLKASCMVRIATSGMYYPGTMERAVLVAGEADGVKKACGLILHTLHVPDNNESGCAKLVDTEKADSIEVTQRMLIPLTAGGLVIGRKGANIAALLEGSGAKVTLGQKADVKVHERLVTVQGKLTSATKAVEMLVDKLLEEPVLSRFANLSVNYRGHGSSKSKAAMAAGIAPAPLPYQRSAGGSNSPPPEEGSVASVGSDSAAAPTTVAAGASPVAGPVVVGHSATSSPATSAAGRRVGSPPRLPSPARAARVPRGGGRVAGRGYGGVGNSRFQPQPPFRQQQMRQQQMRQQQPHRQHQQHQQHQLQHQPQALQFHQHQHQHQQRLSMSPARITPTPPPPPQMQLPLQPQQPGSAMPMMPMSMGPGGPMLPTTVQMSPMGPISHPASAMPMMAMTYAPAPAGAGYHPSGMHVGPVATVGADGQPHGYPAMALPQQHQQQQQQQQHQQQPMVPVEQMTNPVAAAIAACQPTTTVTVGVPNNMIGAILGPGGAIISELQTLSGARINVSQRDAFMPGTENRILTITGAPMATQTAQYLVSQKIEAFVERPRGW